MQPSQLQIPWSSKASHCLSGWVVADKMGTAGRGQDGETPRDGIEVVRWLGRGRGLCVPVGKDGRATQCRAEPCTVSLSPWDTACSTDSSEQGDVLWLSFGESPGQGEQKLSRCRVCSALLGSSSCTGAASLLFLFSPPFFFFL